MGETHTVEGRVINSSVTTPAHPNLLTTKVNVLLGPNEKIPYFPYLGKGRGPHEFNVRGRHILGEREIRLEYECNSGVLWVRRYELLNHRGEVIHSDSALG